MRRRLRWLYFICVASVSVPAIHAAQSPWREYMEQMRVLRQKGAFADAEKAGLSAIAEAEKSGRQDTKGAKSWNNLGTLYVDTGRYADAEKFFSRAVELWEKVLGPDDKELAQGLNNLAVLDLKLGRMKEAESLMVRVLAIREKTLPPDHGDIGESLNTLGELNRAQGRYTEAAPLY